MIIIVPAIILKLVLSQCGHDESFVLKISDFLEFWHEDSDMILHVGHAGLIATAFSLAIKELKCLVRDSCQWTISNTVDVGFF